jgi:type IV/VI secretion system ImpK/VasF family protein
MRSEIAKVVFPVFAYGIRLRESLESGEKPDLQTSQKELLGLLQGTGQIQKWDDMPAGRSLDMASSGAPRTNVQFLGMRYALVAWLDEMFITDSPWKSEWTEHILEHRLYGTRDRAWKFWEQAKKAETQPRTDDLETYYLAAMLGFRGDYDDSPEKLSAWLESAKALIDKGEDQEWQGPVDSQPRTFVPPLNGAGKLQRMVTVVGLSLLLLIPIAMFYIFTYWARP